MKVRFRIRRQLRKARFRIRRQLMKVKTFALVFLAVLLPLALFATPVYAQAVPALPHAFYGTVEINGSPATAGSEVEVRGEGVQTGVGNNPIVITVAGSYGSSNPLEPKLIVQGDIVDGAILTFYVNGVPTGQTVEWHSGEVTELNLTATGAPSPETTGTPSPGTTGAPPPETTEAPPPETTEAPPPETTGAPPPETTGAPPEPTPAAPAEPVNWPVLKWVIGGIAVVGLIIFLLARRKAY